MLRLLPIPLLFAIASLISSLAVSQPPVAAQFTPRAPLNDSFSGAASLSFPATVTVSDIELATVEAGEPLHGCRRGAAGTGSYSVWYKFTLNQPGNVVLHTLNSQLYPNPDTIISIYQGASLDALVEVGCNEDVPPDGYSYLDTWLPTGSYVAKISYWSNNPPQPMTANSSLVVQSSFVASPDTPTPSPTPTNTPPSSTSTPTDTPQSPDSTPTSTPVIVAPTSTLTATKSSAAELVQNGDFELDVDEDNLPDGWTGANLAKDKRVCNTGKKIIAYKGFCAFRFKNKDGEVSKLTQSIPIEALVKQQTLVFSAAVEVIQPVGKAMMLKISYAEPDAGLKGKGKDKVMLRLENITYGYSRLSQSFTLLGTPIKVELKLIHREPGTRLMIDALSLQRQP
jgi:hypothetical protein